MQRYPDPETHLNHHFQQAAKKYGQWMAEEDIQPTPALLQAVGEREFERAKSSYMAQTEEIHLANIAQIRKLHDQRLNQIKREGAALRLKTCPPIAAFFGLTAWYCFTHANLIGGGIMVTGALAFLAMLLFGALFDRPR